MRLETAILSMIRSELTSRSNWAEDRSTLRVLGDRYEGHLVSIKHLNASRILCRRCPYRKFHPVGMRSRIG
jgi:hypothetical protein